MTTTVPAPAPSIPPRASWGWGIWLVVILGAAAELVGAAVALIYIVVDISVDCGTTGPTMGNVHKGEFVLAVAICVGLAPWVVAMSLSSRRVGLGIAGAIAVSPLIYGLLAGADPEFWGPLFCF